jgi:hypothetical protein
MTTNSQEDPVNANNGHLPVVDVDQVFPSLPADTAGGRQSTMDTDQAPVVAAVLRDVLGWRPRAQDSKAFLAALGASFRLREIEGHVESEYVPRGFAIQADLGSVSGGQASLYTRARSGLDQSIRLLDSLVPLRPDADPDDCAAFRLLVRHGITRVVEELGNPGGPRKPVVESAFQVLAGVADTNVTPDTVPGQLGALRDRFGLIDANVNTVDDESIRTAFWTLVDQVLDLRRAWTTWTLATSNGFLGTDLVLISRLLAAAVEQLDDLEAVLDSVLITAAERQTLELSDDGDLTLDGLLSWLRRFLTEDGPMYARDSGRDGMLTAFTPTIGVISAAVEQNLVVPLGGSHMVQTNHQEPPSAVTLLPIGCSAALPPGMYAGRTRVAVASLCRILRDLFEKSAQISRFPGVVLYDVRFQTYAAAQSTTESENPPQLLQVAVRGANFRPTYQPAFSSTTDGPPDHFPYSVSSDDDTLVGVFPITDEWPDGLATLPEPYSVLVPADGVPVWVIDRETGQVVSKPKHDDWNGLQDLAAIREHDTQQPVPTQTMPVPAVGPAQAVRAQTAVPAAKAARARKNTPPERTARA